MTRWLTLPLAALALAACAAEESDPSEAEIVEQEVTASAPTATSYQLRAIAHNIAGGPLNRGAPTAIDEMAAQIAAFTPDVVMLEEVCASQRDAFQARFPTWHLAYVPMVATHSGCAGPQGQLLASKWPISDVTTTPLGDPDGVKEFHLLCADVALPTRGAHDVRACVVHLRAFQDAAAVAARARQARRIYDALHTRIWTQGQAVVLGGDFNVRPWEAALSSIYRLTVSGTATGPGDFREADETDTRYFATSGARCGSTACRSGQFTINDTRKYDYVFFSRNHARARVSGLAADYGDSDHRLYRAFADLSF